MLRKRKCVKESNIEFLKNNSQSSVLKTIHAKISKANDNGLKTLILKGLHGLINDENIPLKLTSLIDIRNLEKVVNFNLIEKLTIQDCSFNPLGIKPLSKCFHNLIFLNLSSNFLGHVGADLLAYGLRTNSTIKDLQISNTRLIGIYIQRSQICGEVILSGFENLLLAFGESSSLRSIDLSFNYLGGVYGSVHSTKSAYLNVENVNNIELNYCDRVVEMICSMLSCNRSVTDLNINKNGFEDSFEIAKSLIDSGVGPNYCCKSLCGLGKYQNINGFEKKISEEITIKLTGSSLPPFTARLLGQEFKLFPNLTSLDISDNLEFGNTGINNFTESILSNGGGCSLKTLLLRRLDLQPPSGDEEYGLAKLLEMGHFGHLTRLDLSDNPSLGDEGCAAVAEALRSNHRLRCLVMRGNNICRSISLLGSVLSGNKTLTLLDVSFNRIDCKGVGLFVDSVHKANYSLKHLFLGGNRLSRETLAKVAQLLDPLSSGVTNLDMNKNELCGRRESWHFDPSPVYKLAAALELPACGLQQLNLSDNDIGARGSQRLCRALTTNRHLHTLLLDGCNLTEVGAVHLGEGLADLQTLRRLGVSRCQLGPAGCQSLFTGLSHNRSLTWLDAGHNELTGYRLGASAELRDYSSEAVTSIRTALTMNTTLLHLSLRDNCLFGLPQQLSTTALSQFQPTALIDMIAAINDNNANGGSLMTLDLLENRIPSCLGHFNYCLCDELGAAEDGSAPDQGDCCLCSELVRLLLAAKRAHPTLASLIGALPNCYCGELQLARLQPATGTPRTPKSRQRLSYTKQNYDQDLTVAEDECWLCGRNPRHLDLRSLFLENQAVRMVADELQHNHSIVSVDLSHNPSDRMAARYMEQALANNVCLRNVQISGDDLRKAKRVSFDYRVAIAVFVRGSASLYPSLNAEALNIVLEYLLGPGLQVVRFLNYRQLK